jgi:hypothetical protein
MFCKSPIGCIHVNIICGQGCQQGKIDQKNTPPKIQLKNGTIFYMDTRKVRERFCSTLPFTHTNTLVEFMQTMNTVALTKFVTCCQYQRTIYPP